MASATTRAFNVAAHLTTPAEIAASLDAVLEEGDDKLLLVALRNVVKSKGFPTVAQGAGYAARPCSSPSRKAAIPGCPP